MTKRITFDILDYCKFINTYNGPEWGHINDWTAQLVAVGFRSAVWDHRSGKTSMLPKEFTMFTLKWS
jgi:hypothetical protein